MSLFLLTLHNWKRTIFEGFYFLLKGATNVSGVQKKIYIHPFFVSGVDKHEKIKIKSICIFYQKYFCDFKKFK